MRLGSTFELILLKPYVCDQNVSIIVYKLFRKDKMSKGVKSKTIHTKNTASCISISTQFKLCFQKQIDQFRNTKGIAPSVR